MKKDKEHQDLTLLLAIQAAIETNTKELRQERVMLEADVAALYKVSSEYLRKQVLKNRGRFPKDFMFQLTVKEYKAISNKKPVGKLPYVFTEMGILMTGGVLDNPRAIKIHIQLIDYFVRLYNEAIDVDSLLKGVSKKIENEGTEEIFAIIKQLLKEE